MEIIPIKTRVARPPKDDIFDIIDTLNVQEGDIVIITSKILAIHQGRTIHESKVVDKDDLIKKEAEVFIPREECPGEYVILTLKNNTLIPSAGIDESNANGYYILWPKNPEVESKKICIYLKKKHNINKLAVIVTDSHTTPLRYGVMGISTGFYGLEPLRDHRGKNDLFGREIVMTFTNVVDSIAAMGVYFMGEVDEQTPIVIARGLKDIIFTEKETYRDLLIDVEEDIYYPLLRRFHKPKEK
jgi:F420-0:gamma-glutamyl ligase